MVSLKKNRNKYLNIADTNRNSEILKKIQSSISWDQISYKTNK